MLNEVKRRQCLPEGVNGPITTEYTVWQGKVDGWSHEVEIKI
jgi:hypothetical protein